MSSTGCSPAFPRVLKDLRLAAEEVPEGCDFRGGRRLLPLNNLPDRDLVRVRWIGRGTGRFRLERGWSRRARSGAGRPRRGPSGTPRLVLEVLLWLVGRYGEQDVMLHVCCKAIQRRPFRMTWLEVGARRALGAVGGAWRDSATMCYSGPGAGRSGGVLPGPVALRALEVASYRRSRGQGQGAPRTCRCIETNHWSSFRGGYLVREHHAPVGALRQDVGERTALLRSRQGAPRTCRCIETNIA